MKKGIVCVLAIMLIFVFAACGMTDYSDYVLEPGTPSEVLTIDEVQLVSSSYETSTLDLASDDSVHELSSYEVHYPESPYDANHPEASFDYLTFEDALVEFATDVVIVQYVGHRSFGESLTEFEFVVSERILGNAADRIFVYAENHINSVVVDSDSCVTFNSGELAFNRGTDYMLVLIGIDSPYASTRENGFVFVRNIVIDLDNPSNSMMYSEPLSLHSTGLNLDTAVSRMDVRQEIIGYVSGLTRPRTRMLPENSFIRSAEIGDIINGSPYVLLVEITEPFRMAYEQSSTDWMATDLYYVTAVQVLKGNKDVGHKFLTVFHADTVLEGELHIIAVEPVREGSSWFQFTSQESLFCVNQLDEIIQIIGN